jgi:aconitase B
MKATITVLLAASILTAFGPAAADSGAVPAEEEAKAITGMILSVNYATGDLLVYQDSGSVIALYGLNRSGLRDIGAGDRVTVIFGPNLEVVQIQKMAVQAIGYD